jgi:hypothetical protein
MLGAFVMDRFSGILLLGNYWLDRIIRILTASIKFIIIL